MRTYFSAIACYIQRSQSDGKIYYPSQDSTRLTSKMGKLKHNEITCLVLYSKSNAETEILAFSPTANAKITSVFVARTPWISIFFFFSHFPILVVFGFFKDSI